MTLNTLDILLEEKRGSKVLKRLNNKLLLRDQINASLEGMLSERNTAVIAFHDLIAIDAIEAIMAHGLRIPQDVALAGFDGLNASLLTKPSITTFQPPLHKIGKQSVKHVLNFLKNSKQSPNRRFCQFN